MKILRLVIHSFGNLSNRIIDFSENTNVIMGTNGEVINTIEKFLDGMLFGLSNEDKKKYRPRRLPFSGTLFFENDQGEQIQIDRNFLNDVFSATDVNGNDVTEDYTDEFGSLALFPVSDSVFAKKTIEIPEVTDKDINKLEELKSKRETLAQRYKIDELIKERDELAEKINVQKELENELKYNNEIISKNEQRVQAITGDTEAREKEINQQILSLKSELQQVELEINKLREKSNTDGVGKGRILKRDIHNYDQRISLIDEHIKDLEKEEKLYSDELAELKRSFTINREELKADYNEYQNGLEQNRKEKDLEPLVTRLMQFSSWIYFLLILLGIIGVAFVLYNPNDALDKPPIYLISFISVFIVLVSCTIIYLQFSKPQLVTAGITGSNYTPGVDSERIIKKYKQNSQQDFEIFFNNAKKVYNRMDNLEADLNDIHHELKEAEDEKAELINGEHDININLHKNKISYENTDIDNKVFDLTKKRNQINAQIDELVEERQEIQEDSIWKLREESLILSEKNQQLLDQDQEYNLRDLENQYEKIQKKIDQYNEKVSKLDQQINSLENKINNSRADFAETYAVPGEADYDQKLAQQFGFGLQNNLLQHNDVPFITFNPFVNAGELSDALLDKFKMFIENKQTLIFSTEFDDLDTLNNKKIKYNGIFIR